MKLGQKGSGPPGILVLQLRKCWGQDRQTGHLQSQGGRENSGQHSLSVGRLVDGWHQCVDALS